jgi:thiamine-monophosphate kinase
MNERELVARVRELFSPRIGDDAAVIGNQVMTTDMLVEDVDFTRAIPLRYVGRKSIAVNLSDIAAMGATPRWLLVSLALPEWATADVDALLHGLRDAAAQHGAEIIGGDLSRSEKLILSVTAIGELQGRALLRSGAKPGDRIFLSRPVGGSSAGLQLLTKGWTVDGAAPPQFGYSHREFASSAIRRHVDPEPEVELGKKLAAIDDVTSCIDVSDGLSTDLHNLCEASGCGAEIERERIPIFPDLLGAASTLDIGIQDAVLNGGEEYALLFTARARESDLSARIGRAVYAIGRMTGKQGVMLKENTGVRALERRGWDHFNRGCADERSDSERRAHGVRATPVLHHRLSVVARIVRCRPGLELAIDRHRDHHRRRKHAGETDGRCRIEHTTHRAGVPRRNRERDRRA